ncbi:CHAT domain-containing protein [Marinoscillum sp. MHG1-6]|uniref:CHAT domain-containing protein n=1 Tax=Marinoscillum sp. MHG1-6 TaxID=2959627 RepID=UPI00215733D8|nr:CHAT domain-containing protein [Marinoscillum sp. MHG1-6]
MVRIASLISGFILICTLTPSLAQYKFESKKAEKLYYKLEGYYDNYEYDKILKNEESIQSFYLDRKDTLAALMNSFLGESYLYWYNDMQTALSYFQQEYDLRKELGSNDISTVIFNLGYIKDELGRYNETEELYLELLKIEEAKYGKESEEYYTSAFTLAEHYMFVEQTQKGLDLCKELKKSVKKNSLNEAMILKTMGDLYTLEGNYSRAEKNLSNALEILDDAGLYASIEYVSTLSSLAGLYNETGKVPQAEEVFLQAKDILSKMQGDQTEYLMILDGNLALNYTDLGNYDEAEKIFLKNLELDVEFYGDNSYPFAIDAGNLADNYRYAGKLSKAEEYYNKAGEAYKSIVGEESVEYGRILQNLSYVNNKKGDDITAIELGLKAVKTFEKVGANASQQAFANYYLGEAYFTSGDLDNAEKYHVQALELRRKALGKSHPDYALSTTKMAILNWKKKDYKTALSYYKETFDNYFNQINLVFPILSEEEKTKFYYNKLKPAFEQYNSFIIETSSEDNELIGEMYDNQLATKGIILSASQKVRETIMNSGDSTLMERYDQWIDTKEKLTKLFSASNMPVAARNKKIDSLTNLSNIIEKELSKSSAAFASTYANTKTSWKDIQEALLPGEAAIEIIRFRDFSTDSAGVFTDEVYYAALILTPETTAFPEMVIMRNGKKMETRFLSNYRNAIKYKVNEDYSYRLFWRPIANKIPNIKKVYLSPDGVYNQISIYTLRNPATGNFLIDEVELHIVTNSKDLIAANTSSGKAGKSYLFGYPNYNMGIIDDQSGEEKDKSAESAVKAASEGRGISRGGRGVESQPGGLSRGGSIPRGLRGNMLRYMRSNQLLALLPGTKKEVGLIDSLYISQSADVMTLLSNDALEDSIKTIRNPKTLHIATHGFFLEHDEEDIHADEYVANPLLRSGLILAGANSFIARGKISETESFEDDGILTAYEAMNLNLDGTELVVLSACETGLGEIKNGEGVYGLQRAFRVAGAETMIMSMWTVDDDATQELMTTFYQEWLSGKDKQTAFNIAQKRIKDKWKAPYYWGAFVMVGE